MRTRRVPRRQQAVHCARQVPTLPSQTRNAAVLKTPRWPSLLGGQRSKPDGTGQLRVPDPHLAGRSTAPHRRRAAKAESLVNPLYYCWEKNHDEL